MTRICIATPQHYQSETFIRAHEEFLDGDKVILTGSYPNFHYNGRLLSTQFNKHNRFRRLLKLLPHLAFERYGDRILPAADIGLRSLYEFFHENPVDVILAEYGTTGANLTPVARDLGIPLIVHFHGHDAYHRGYLSDFSERLSQMFAYASAIISVSEAMSQQLIRIGAPSDKIILNPYGPRESFFEVRPTYDPQLIAVGRFVEMKAPQITLAAFHQVLDTCPRARLVMVGDGPLREACMTLADAWGISDRVSFPGTFGHTEIIPLLASSCAFVQHSVQSMDGTCEGTPVAILEAGAAALPVIATYHAGIPQAVRHGETGLLGNEKDIGTMSTHMIQLLTNANLCKSLGQQARDYIRKAYSLDRHIIVLNEILLKTNLE